MTNHQCSVNNGRRPARIGRCVLVSVLLALAGPAWAQIFPELEREDVLKRAPAGADTPKPVKPVEGGAKVDGEAVLKRYNDLLSGYLNERSLQKKACAPFTDKVHDSVRKYIEAAALLRLGYYDEAAKGFDGVGLTVKRDADIKGPTELRTVIGDIKAGKAWHYRMIAVAMQEYRDFKDDKEGKEFDAAWERARKAGQKVIDDWKSQISRKRVDDATGLDTQRKMEAWLGLGKGIWRNLARADQRVQQRPHEVESWVGLIDATGSTSAMTSDSQILCCLKHRAAAQVTKEFWPAAPAVTDGVADIALALSHLGAFQFDDYGQYLVAQSYHSDIGKAALDDFLDRARKAQELLLKLRDE